MQPHRGCAQRIENTFSPMHSQGSPAIAGTTLGWRTQSLWDFHFSARVFITVKFLLLVLLLIPASLRADPLSDLRTTLQKLQSDQLLRARVEIKSRRTGGENNKQK